MQVKIEVSPEHTPPRAVIYTDRITPEIQRALDMLQAKDTPVLAERDGRTFLLAAQEVYMIRVVGGETKLYTKLPEHAAPGRIRRGHVAHLETIDYDQCVSCFPVFIERFSYCSDSAISDCTACWIRIPLYKHALTSFAKSI